MQVSALPLSDWSDWSEKTAVANGGLSVRQRYLSKKTPGTITCTGSSIQTNADYAMNVRFLKFSLLASL